jgi:hypothetical protein
MGDLEAEAAAAAGDQGDFVVEAERVQDGHLLRAQSRRPWVRCHGVAQPRSTRAARRWAETSFIGRSGGSVGLRRGGAVEQRLRCLLLRRRARRRIARPGGVRPCGRSGV